MLPSSALTKSKVISLHPPIKLTNTNSPILAFQDIYELIAAWNPSFALILAWISSACGGKKIFNANKYKKIKTNKNSDIFESKKLCNFKTLSCEWFCNVIIVDIDFSVDSSLKD